MAFEILVDKSIESLEITEISKLNLEKFRKNVSLNCIKAEDKNVYFTLSNTNLNSLKSYIFLLIVKI